VAGDFGPRKLKAVVQAMVEEGLSRGYINHQLGRIKRMFRWAVSEELIPPGVAQALDAVSGLRKGRTTAKERDQVRPVEKATVEATLAYVQPVVADMVRVQLLTGSRPNEICILRPGDIDRTVDVWQYVPATHKNEHRGRQRVIFIGPKAQEILQPYLLRPDWVYCFSPSESERRRRELAHQARKTPMSCGNRPGTNRSRQPKRSAGSQYTTDSYRRAIHRAVEKANQERCEWNTKHPGQRVPLLEKWSPNRLRHSAGTEVRRQFGLEAAQVVLGHALADVTQVYAERDFQLARDVVKQIG
jgi:integrase